MSTAVAAAPAPASSPHRRQRLLAVAAGMVAALLALYVLLPRVAGLDDTWGRLRNGDATWLALAGAFEICSYTGYVVLLRTVAGGAEAALSWRAAWRLTLAGVAASRLLATAGAGGIALTAWALRRMGLDARTVATRMATFFVLLYAVFMAALVVCGLGLGLGWLPGPSPFALTIVPALFGAVVIAAVLALEHIPPQFGRRTRAHGLRAGGGRTARIARAIRRCSARSAGGSATRSSSGRRCTPSARRRRRRCSS